MLFRGPDGEGYFVDGPFGFGMRRLAIIDIDGGSQPICNEEGNIHVICNGEIYNHRELRQGLEKEGTNSNQIVMLRRSCIFMKNSAQPVFMN